MLEKDPTLSSQAITSQCAALYNSAHQIMMEHRAKALMMDPAIRFPEYWPAISDRPRIIWRGTTRRNYFERRDASCCLFALYVFCVRRLHFPFLFFIFISPSFTLNHQICLTVLVSNKYVQLAFFLSAHWPFMFNSDWLNSNCSQSEM